MNRHCQRDQMMDAISRLLKRMTHDLNNYLQVISGNTFILNMSQQADGTANESLADISAATDGATSYLRRMLIMSGQCDATLIPISLNDVVEASMKDVSAQGFDVRFELEPHLPSFRADRRLIEQALNHLVTNAMESYEAPGEIRLVTGHLSVSEDEVGQHPWRLPGTFLSLTIVDRGRGIPEEDQVRVFAPFFNTKQVKKAGVGLPFAYGVVRLHDGWMELDSIPGEGTTVRLYFPVSDNASHDEPSVQEVEQTSGQRPLILLAEDQDNVRAYFIKVIERGGYQYLAASDGAEAVEIFEANAHRIAVAILDSVMPKLSGVEVLRTLRASRPDLPIIFSTGYTDSDIRLSDEERRAVSFLEKPFGPVQLLDMLETLLER